MSHSQIAVERILKSTFALAALACAMSGCNSQPAVATGNASGEKAQSTNSTDDDKPDARPTAPRVKLRPGAKTKVLDRAGDRPFDKTFDDLRFEMEVNGRFRREMLTEEIKELAGQHIRIRGYILPTAQKRGVKQFVLVRDNQECCFGQGAALFDCILVEMAAGKTAEYSIRPVAVAGTFDIREFVGPDDRHLAIYHLEADSVE
jgi:hypothetical protein